MNEVRAPTLVIIGGAFAGQAIKDLGALGVFDSTSGAFHPNDPVKRADFVRRLVKANNIYYKADSTQQIRLAAGNEATFVDVPPSNTDFKYIQGMTNAGYVIGTDAKHFAPDQKLTREQMIAIKAARDAGGSNTKDVSQQFLTMRLGKTDTTQIAKPYWGAFYDDFSAATSGNFKRVYGSVKIFNPKKLVTRGEAALALSVFGGEIPERKAAQLLGQPSATP